MDNVTLSLKDSMMFLQLNNVSRKFGGLLAIDAIDLAIEQGEIGQFRSMVCNFSWSLSRGHSYTLSLFRMFAGAPVE